MRFLHVSSRLRRDAVVLVAFAAVASFYLLASALSHVLPLNAPRGSFLTVLRGLEWRHVLSTDFLAQAFLVLPAAAMTVFYTLSTPRRVRIACAVTGWLLPLFVLWDGVPEIGRWLLAIPRAFAREHVLTIASFLESDWQCSRGFLRSFDGHSIMLLVGWKDWWRVCS